MKQILAVALLLAAVVSGCRIQKIGPGGGRWELLGARVVKFSTDHDVILAGLQGSYRAIKVEVHGSKLEMYNIRVHFMNGEVFQPTVRHNFKPGSWTRVIDLPGHKRVIKHIEFWYRTATPQRGHAKVTVWGLH
jgi:hypothetical protein